MLVLVQAWGATERLHPRVVARNCDARLLDIRGHGDAKVTERSPGWHCVNLNWKKSGCRLLLLRVVAVRTWAGTPEDLAAVDGISLV